MANIIKQPFLPKITIKKNDASLLTYDPTAGGNPPTSGTYDFRLVSANIRPPYDQTGGQFTITIISSDGTNSAMNTLLTSIREDNEVTFWVGKTAATLVKMLLGKIENIEVKEPNKDLMYVTISGPDWGSDILKNLVVNRSWIQKKSVADQNVLDTTDNKTRLGQIVEDLLTDPKSFPDNKFPVTPSDLGVIVTAGNYPSATTSDQLPQIEANMERVDDKLTELDELAGTSHSVDANKTFFMKPTTSFSLSGVLLTDDESDSAISPTYVGKVGFIAPGSSYVKTVESHKARLYGIGASTFTKDQSQETTTGSSSLTSNWFAQRFTPVKQDCFSIGVYVGYTGSPTIDLTLILVEDNANLPTGSTLRTLSVGKTALTSTGAWYYFPIGEKLTIGNNYWVVLAGNNAGNTYLWYRDTTDHNPSLSATSTDGISWALTSTPNRFSFAFVEHANDLITAIYPTGITSATKHLHDEVIRKTIIKDSTLMLKYLQSLYLRLGKRKEIFTGRIYAPDQLLTSNQYIRIRKQLSGYVVDAFFVLGQIEYVFDSSDNSATGSLYLDVEAVRFSDYP